MIKSILLNITSPMKMEDMQIEYKLFNLFTGMNAVGKSLINKFLFCHCLIASAYGKCPDIKEFAQFVYDRTFSDHNTNGIIRVNFEKCYLEITFEKGQVTSVFTDIEDQIITPITYMSTSMRTFEAISSYLKLRKRVKGTPEKIMNEMSLEYKLYDAMYIEKLIAKCPVKIEGVVKEGLSQFIKDEEILIVDVDLEKCDFFTLSNNGTRYLTTYSSGDQSIINMMLGNM